MIKQFLCSLVLVASCTSGESKPAADAATTNLPFGATCLTVSDTSTECTSGVCTDSFNALGHNVCSQKCTTGMDQTCPSGGSGMKCNTKGYCKP
jgi:hypothetical protein